MKALPFYVSVISISLYVFFTNPWMKIIPFFSNRWIIDPIFYFIFLLFPKYISDLHERNKDEFKDGINDINGENKC